MGISKKYGLYVFDLDGTVADTKVDLGRALKAAVAAAGLEEPNEQQVVASIGQGARKAIQKLTGLDDAALDPYLEIFMKRYDEVCCDNVTLYPGTAELLQRLKQQGAYIALVTMKFKSATHKIIKAMNIDIFDAVVTFDDIEKRKPDPESLYMLMKRFNVPAQEALMVGDSLTDLKYAKNAGVDVCIMEYGYAKQSEIEEQNPTYILKDFYVF